MTTQESQNLADRAKAVFPDSLREKLEANHHGKYVAIVTIDGWTRVLPTDWLLERKSLLPLRVGVFRQRHRK